MKNSDKNRINERERRYFSETFRKLRVKEYNEGKASVAEISRNYGVSGTSVYKWIAKYTPNYKKTIVKVVEEKSATKRSLELKKEVGNLEQLVGQQQVELLYLKKLIEVAEKHYGIDIKKNLRKEL